MRHHQLYFAGTSNIALPVANKAAFPPAFQQSSRLNYYASLFNSLEVNSTFKKNLLPATLQRWTTEVHESFRFSFKMPASVTHAPDLSFERKSITDFLKVIDSMDRPKGAILLQFPSKVTIALQPVVNKILDIIQHSLRSEQWTIALEFRHASWYTDALKQLLVTYNAAMVIHDLPTFINPGNEYLDSPAIYLRLHGTEKGYKGSYPVGTLQRYAAQIRQWNANGKLVYVYFNNTLGAAAKDLITLNRMLGMIL